MNIILPFTCLIGTILAKEIPVKIEKISRIEIEKKSNDVWEYTTNLELTDSDTLLYTNLGLSLKNTSDSVFYWPVTLQKPGSKEWPLTKLIDSNTVTKSNNFGLKDEISKKYGIMGRFNYWVFEPDSLIPIWPGKTLYIHFLDTFELKKNIKLDFSYQFYIADKHQVKNFKFIERGNGKRMSKHIFCNFDFNLTYKSKRNHIKINIYRDELGYDKLNYFRID